MFKLTTVYCPICNEHFETEDTIYLAPRNSDGDILQFCGDHTSEDKIKHHMANTIIDLLTCDELAVCEKCGATWSSNIEDIERLSGSDIMKFTFWNNNTMHQCPECTRFMSQDVAETCNEIMNNGLIDEIFEELACALEERGD